MFLQLGFITKSISILLKIDIQLGVTYTYTKSRDHENLRAL